MQHYKYKIASKTLKQTEDSGNGLISKLSNELDVQYSKFETQMKEQKDEDRIRVAMCVFTIFTTNLTPVQLEEKYGKRIVDRLNEMVEKVVFENESYRR